jgi:3-oxoacyl-[acyl-carrier protein] reductase
VNAAPRCLVIGGSGYVGAEVCRTLASRGARVAFSYHHSDTEAKALEAELPGARAWRMDLKDADAVRGVVDSVSAQWDGLDAVVQCAGIAGDRALYHRDADGRRERLARIDEHAWDEMMDVSVRGTFIAFRAAAARMPAGGHLVVVGSMDGVKALPSPQHYAAAKGALRSMVQSLAQELGDAGILANMVAPGLLDGGMSRLLGPELIEDYLAHCALKRLGTAKEVAEMVAYLALENTYVNGQAILLDGGL